MLAVCVLAVCIARCSSRAKLVWIERDKVKAGSGKGGERPHSMIELVIV